MGSNFTLCTEVLDEESSHDGVIMVIVIIQVLTFGSTYLAKCISHSAKVGKTISIRKTRQIISIIKIIAETLLI